MAAKNAKLTRFNILLTDEEMSLLDEFAAGHSLRSRADAIRHLIQIGLRANDIADPIDEQHLRLARLASRTARRMLAVRDRINAADGDEQKLQAYSSATWSLMEDLLEVLYNSNDVLALSSAVSGPVHALRGSTSIQDLLKVAKGAAKLPEDEQRRVEEDARRQLEGMRHLAGKPPRDVT